MFGSKLFKPYWGKWDHFGVLKTNHVWLSASNADAGTLPKGTFLDFHPTIEGEAVLASGNFVGMLIEDMDQSGVLSVQSYYDRSIGRVENPLRKGTAVSLRRFYAGGMAEFEGLGVSAPGNLVITSGTGAISAATARKTELSTHNGGLRVAQSGDIVIALMEKANLTPEIAGNVRIRIRFTGCDKKA